MGNRTKRAIRLAAPLALGVAAAIVAAVSSGRILALDHLLTWSWLPSVVLSLLLLVAAAGIALALPRSRAHSGDPTVPDPVIPRPSTPQALPRPPILSHPRPPSPSA